VRAEKSDLEGNPTLVFVSSLVFNTLLSVVVFFLFGGRDLLQRRVDPDETEVEASERFKRETAEGGQPAIRGGAVAMAPEAPALDRDRILTLIGIAALVIIALTLDWDGGFVAVTIATILSLLMPHATRARRTRSPGRPCC
jgi:hypothetical protein